MIPSPRTIQRALGVLTRLPIEAQADLAERIIDRLDEADPDPDLEEEHDACDAGECGGVPLLADGQPGDSTDAEPDDDDLGAGEDEPQFGDRLRPARTGLGGVRLRRSVPSRVKALIGSAREPAR